MRKAAPWVVFISAESRQKAAMDAELSMAESQADALGAAERRVVAAIVAGSAAGGSVGR
jgi:hypothetical protein